MSTEGKGTAANNYGLPRNATVADLIPAPDIALLLRSNPSIADGRIDVLVWDEKLAESVLAARTAAHKRVVDAASLRVLQKVPPLAKCHDLADQFECLQVRCRWRCRRFCRRELGAVGVACSTGVTRAFTAVCVCARAQILRAIDLGRKFPRLTTDDNGRLAVCCGTHGSGGGQVLLLDPLTGKSKQVLPATFGNQVAQRREVEKGVINSPPDEAIIVLLDASGSMRHRDVALGDRRVVPNAAAPASGSGAGASAAAAAGAGSNAGAGAGAAAQAGAGAGAAAGGWGGAGAPREIRYDDDGWELPVRAP